MKIISINGDEGLVETHGLKKKVNTSLLKNPTAGDYVLIHAGFAIEKLKTAEAKKTLEALKIWT